MTRSVLFRGGCSCGRGGCLRQQERLLVGRAQDVIYKKRRRLLVVVVVIVAALVVNVARVRGLQTLGERVRRGGVRPVARAVVVVVLMRPELGLVSVLFRVGVRFGGLWWLWWRRRSGRRRVLVILVVHVDFSLTARCFFVLFALE
jgi:hypothetical protein